MHALFKCTLKTYKNGWCIKPQGKSQGIDIDKSRNQWKNVFKSWTINEKQVVWSDQWNI